MRDLLNDPAWLPEDLGTPLPDSPHAVSVAMPCWQDVIDYEENRPRVVDALHCGYPRFFVHPTVAKLFRSAERRFAKGGECCVVFPTQRTAERCKEFVEARTGDKLRLETHGSLCGAVAVVMAAGSYKTARLFWRYCGETTSSRMAERILTAQKWVSTGSRRMEETVRITLRPDFVETGARIARPIRERLAALAGVSPDDVFLFTSGMAAVFA